MCPRVTYSAVELRFFELLKFPVKLEIRQASPSSCLNSKSALLNTHHLMMLILTICVLSPRTNCWKPSKATSASSYLGEARGFDSEL